MSDARRRSIRLGLVSLLVLASACQNGQVAQDLVIHVTPAAVTVQPGQTIQFSVTNIQFSVTSWEARLHPTDVTWSVEPPGVGTIDERGLFVAALVPVPGYPTGTVAAVLKSDPSKVGMAVLTFESGPTPPATLPTTMAGASGGKATGGASSLEAVVLEPVAATNQKSPDGKIEVRGGFYPTGTVQTP